MKAILKFLIKFPITLVFIFPYILLMILSLVVSLIIVYPIMLALDCAGYRNDFDPEDSIFWLDGVGRWWRDL